MGCWHETCGFTNLPIVNGEPIRLMIIGPVKDKSSFNSLMSPFEAFWPLSILAKGTYNDYGWIDFASDAEKDRFFASARSVGLVMNPDEDGNVELPKGFYQWMIREDAFQMIGEIPLDSWRDDHPKTVGEATGKLVPKAKALREESIKIHNGIEYHNLGSTERRTVSELSRQYGRLFDRGENLLGWPLYREVQSEMRIQFYSGVSPMVGPGGALHDALEGDDEKIADIADLMHIYRGMGATRKTLAPTTPGMSSQQFNDEAYMLLAKFYETAVKKWEDYCNG